MKTLPKAALKLTALLLLLITYAAPHITEDYEPQQCLSTLVVAIAQATILQADYWANGGYTSSGLWINANCMENLNNLMLALNVNTWETVNFNSMLAQLTVSNPGDWASTFSGYNNDAQWAILYYYKAADYLQSRNKDNTNFIKTAASIYDYVSTQWDETCGGGIWYSSANNYKGAATNALYLLISAYGYVRTGNQTYLGNAEKTGTWLLNSGMRNSDGLFNDGIDTTCKNNSQSIRTYNQGLIASSLGYLGKALNNTIYFDIAEMTLDATIAEMTENGILKEFCDDPESGGLQCDENQQMFKGVFTKHLQYYLDAANDLSRTEKYMDFLSAQSSAVLTFARNSKGQLGSVWYAADQGGSEFTAQTTGSGLSATIAAAKYGTCTI